MSLGGSRLETSSQIFTLKKIIIKDTCCLYINSFNLFSWATSRSVFERLYVWRLRNFVTPIDYLLWRWSEELSTSMPKLYLNYLDYCGKIKPEACTSSMWHEVSVIYSRRTISQLKKWAKVIAPHIFFKKLFFRIFQSI